MRTTLKRRIGRWEQVTGNGRAASPLVARGKLSRYQQPAKRGRVLRGIGRFMLNVALAVAVVGAGAAGGFYLWVPVPTEVTGGGWTVAETLALEGGLLVSPGEFYGPDGAGFVKAAMAIANREVATRQLGYFLGFLGQRVLGQYDLALLSAGSTPGQLLFVDENIRRTATLLDLPLDPFRTWIALHETTHAFEFEAHPWLRPYLAGRLEEQLSSLSGDVSMLSRDALARLGRMLRRNNSGEHWMEGLMSEEQRRGFREIQAVMSLLEGFGDYVMDEVGRELVPGVEEISRQFHARRDQRTGFERAMMRITGMDLKMEQYRKGEEFVASIATAGGPQALRALWLGPETLPSPEEIATPARWLDRVMPTKSIPLKGEDR